MVSTTVFYDVTRRHDLGRWVVKVQAEDQRGQSHSLQMAFKRKPKPAEREDAIGFLTEKLHFAIKMANEKLVRS